MSKVDGNSTNNFAYSGYESVETKVFDHVLEQTSSIPIIKCLESILEHHVYALTIYMIMNILQVFAGNGDAVSLLLNGYNLR